jgi:integrase
MAQRSELKPSQFWGTLLVMYTGARLNEIMQLHPSDIFQDDGIWVVRITDKGEGQRLKNKASRRTVPLHSYLVDLGLPTYAASCTGSKLFSELEHGSRGDYGRNVSYWFNRNFLVKLGIKDHLVDLHSFRRAIVTQLSQHDVEEPKVAALVGHKRKGMTQLYNKTGYTLKQLQTALENFRVGEAK